MLIAAGFWVLSPFLISIIWAVMIVVSTWPVLLRVQAWLWGRRGPAVAVMTGMLLLVIVLPVSFAIAAIVDKADEITSMVSGLATFTLPPPPEWLAGIPLVGPKLAERWQQLISLSPEELAAGVAPYARQAAGWFIAKAGSLGMMLLYFLMTVIISALLYARGERAAEMVLGFFRRLAGKEGETAVVLAAKAVRGVALGVVVTAVIQAIIGGIGLAVTGVPAAVLLSGVMFMLSLAQIGPAPVLVPAVIWLYWKDGMLWGSLLLIVTILALTVDNVVSPALIKKGVDLPLPMIFAGVTGGLLAFGVVGLFIGPAVLAVSFTLLEAWIQEGKQHTAVAPDAD